jgi:hypothetical protein
VEAEGSFGQALVAVSAPACGANIPLQMGHESLQITQIHLDELGAETKILVKIGRRGG